MLKFFFIFFLSVRLLAQAQTQSELDHFLEQELYQDIEQTQFHTVEQIGEKLDARLKDSQKAKILSTRKYQRFQEKWHPRSYRAMLKKGTLLQKIESQKLIKATRDIYVLAQEIELHGPSTYILNHDGNASYIAQTSQVLDIENDFMLYPPKPPIDPALVYQAPTLKQSQDKKLKLTSEISLLNENPSTSYFDGFLGEVLNDTKSSSFQVRVMTQNILPLKFGLVLGTHSGNGIMQPSNHLFKWNALNIGVAVKYPIKKTQNFEFLVSGEALHSLKFTGKNQDLGDEFSFNSNSYSLSLDSYFLTGYGDFGIGILYRLTTLGVEKPQRNNITYPAEKGDLSAWGISLNYRFGFFL